MTGSVNNRWGHFSSWSRLRPILLYIHNIQSFMNSSLLAPLPFPLNRRSCIFFFSIHLVKCSLCPEALDMDRTWPRKNYWNLILPPTFSLFFLNLKMHLLPKALFWRGRYSREPLNKIYSLLRRQINGNCKRTGKLSQGLICVFILAVTIVSITALGK